VWGAWAVTLGAYLNTIQFTGAQIGLAYSTTAIAAIVSPFFVGMIADRFFPAQFVLAAMHLLGAVLMFAVSRITDPMMFFWMLLLYALCYMPTLALVNAISFHRMDDPGKQFPAVRVLGTIGWIVVGQAIGRLGWDTTVYPIQIAAAGSLAMGLYSLTLPHTPPKGRETKITIGEILGLETLKLMKDRSFAVFVISSLLISIPLAFYYSFTNAFLNEIGWPNPAGRMTFGQMSEVLFMLVMPFFFRKLGVKMMLLVGMLAWTIRYVFFAFGDLTALGSAMFFAGILLHGICYDFFFVTGQLYVDRKAPVAIRANAQGFIALVTYGAGMVIGNNIAGRIVDMYKTDTGHLWKTIWMYPAAMALVIVVLFALFFNDKADQAKS
jgi:nucleoside transporter